MKVYFDTSLLLKLYCVEQNSTQAVALVQSFGTPIVFCELQRTELQNAVWRKSARKEITPAGLKKALKDIQGDFDRGTLKSPDLDWPAVWKEASRLTAKHVLATQCRTLDILHVAVALQLGIKTFATADSRQLSLAGKTGLKTVTLS